MLHLYDRATMAHALTLDLHPQLHRLLTERVAALQTEFGDLTDLSEFRIIQPGNTEADIVRAVGFTPLVGSIDGYRFPDPRFEPWWDWLADRGEIFELIVTVGDGGFAYVLLIEDTHGVPGDLLTLCRRYAGR